MRKTKIIATVGPASSDMETLNKMIREGVDVIRLNFAHGTLEEKHELIRMIREIEESIDDYVAIMADIPGRGPRIGRMPKKYMDLGERVVFVFGERESDNPHIIPVPPKELQQVIDVGDEVLLADGRVIIRIDRILENEAEGTVISDGELRGNVSITIRDKPLPFPPLSESCLLYTSPSPRDRG